jgi:hypothetical protein
MGRGADSIAGLAAVGQRPRPSPLIYLFGLDDEDAASYTPRRIRVAWCHGDMAT